MEVESLFLARCPGHRAPGCFEVSVTFLKCQKNLTLLWSVEKCQKNLTLLWRVIRILNCLLTLLEYALKCQSLLWSVSHFSEVSQKSDTSLKCRNLKLSESFDTSLKCEKNTFWSIDHFSENLEESDTSLKCRKVSKESDTPLKSQKNLTDWHVSEEPLLWRVRRIWSVACLKCQKNLSIFKSLLWSVTSL